MFGIGDACGVAGFTSFTLTLTEEHFGIMLY